MEVFETGMSILFSEPEINAGSPGEHIQVAFRGMPKIGLRIADINPAHVGLFAHHVWKSSILLSQIVLEQRYGVSVAGARCLELGGGAGLVSVVCSLVGAKAIVSSEYPDASIIEALESNMQSNYQVVGHCWGSPTQADFGDERFEIILMADTLWISDQHDNLIKDLQALLQPGGYIIATAGLHTGYTAVESFFHKAEQAGFQIERLDTVLVPIGNELNEDQEWARTAEISDAVEDRRRFLIVFRMTFAQ
ncbi:uncharacterized protein BJ171DRAFT_582338 [Polychytrium aggregatum]|uniref:uncharacterized protein n=1 Tax=Polychytrium aggregatum TaxID=110093 RepID=UPI0022FE495C|nr:uncharacterized protein BJ171DRAFT_582338 [Polychytrium aggregatum]KAI9203961.1 hypothetical protein BJ171DRAFT_582338 [Polychytrium aggregatum]